MRAMNRRDFVKLAGARLRRARAAAAPRQPRDRPVACRSRSASCSSTSRTACSSATSEPRPPPAPRATTPPTSPSLPASQPLEAFRSDMLLFENLDMVSATTDPTSPANAHYAGETHALTGAYRLRRVAARRGLDRSVHRPGARARRLSDGAALARDLLQRRHGLQRRLQGAEEDPVHFRGGPEGRRARPARRDLRPRVRQAQAGRVRRDGARWRARSACSTSCAGSTRTSRRACRASRSQPRSTSTCST